MEVAFYIDYDWTQESTTVIESLFDKHFSKFLVGHEISKSGVHHLQCWTMGYKCTSYTNFIQKVVKMLNLNGKATKNVRKQYGRIKGVIKDTDSMISYCLKERLGHWSKGLDPDYIQIRMDNSYTKAPSKLEKFDEFLTQASLRIAHLRDEPFGEQHYGKYNRMLEICTLISDEYYIHYENVIPNTLVDKVLLKLDLQTHTDLAKTKFYKFLPQDPKLHFDLA